MKKRSAIIFVLALTVGATMFLAGCSNKEEEEKQKLIQKQIEVIEEQLAAVDQHQENLQQMIESMQQEIITMQEELNKGGPRIHAAKVALGSLKGLTIQGLGDSPIESTLKEPAWSPWNILWLLLFVFILWLLYRIKIRKEA